MPLSPTKKTRKDESESEAESDEDEELNRFVIILGHFLPSLTRLF